MAKVIEIVMVSAVEAESGALFLDGQEAMALRDCLEAMGHPQPAAPMKTDNGTVNGMVNNTMKQKRSKAIDMRFHWLQDRTNQGQFRMCWEAGATNFDDFHTKHHPAVCHKTLRPIHTHIEGLSPETPQGCVKMMKKRFSENLNPSEAVTSARDTR